MPKSTEAHLHVMNTLPCHVLVKVPAATVGGNMSSDKFSHFDIDPMSNEVILGLEEKDYQVIIKPATQTEECQSLGKAVYSYKGKGGKVTEMLLEKDSEKKILASEIPTGGEPKKTDNSYPKLRYTYFVRK